MKPKHKNTYPYEWYVYKDDSDICPECGNRPRDYRVPSSHIAIMPPVIFECANGHKWTEATIKIKSYEDLKGELSPDELKRLYQGEWVKPDDYSVCPRCNENAFHSDGFQQDTDGQYSHRWSCENCKYTETL